MTPHLTVCTDHVTHNTSAQQGDRHGESHQTGQAPGGTRGQGPISSKCGTPRPSGAPWSSPPSPPRPFSQLRGRLCLAQSVAPSANHHTVTSQERAAPTSQHAAASSQTEAHRRPALVTGVRGSTGPSSLLRPPIQDQSRRLPSETPLPGASVGKPTRTCVHTHIGPGVHMNALCTHVCVQMLLHTCMHILPHTCVQAHHHMHAYTFVHTCTCFHTPAYMQNPLPAWLPGSNQPSAPRALTRTLRVPETEPRPALRRLLRAGAEEHGHGRAGRGGATEGSLKPESSVLAGWSGPHHGGQASAGS